MYVTVYHALKLEEEWQKKKEDSDKSEKLKKIIGDWLMKLSKLTKPELEEILENANLTEDEEYVFQMLSKGKSLEQIAFEHAISTATVSRRIESIKNKIGGDYMKTKEVPIWEKVTLTIEEAAAYSNIGIHKIRELSNNPRCGFVVFVGKKRLIKRKSFEKYIEENVEL